MEARPKKKYRRPPARVNSVKPVDRRRFYPTPGLRAARVRRGMTQEQLEKASGLSRLTIHNLEWGDRRARRKTVEKLLAGLSTVEHAEPEEILKKSSRKRKDEES